MDSSSNIIGNYLKEKRVGANLLQREVAKRAGVAVSTVSRIENGELLPTVPVLTKVGEALELDLTELLAKLGAHTKRDLPELEDYLREKYGVSEETIESVGVYFRRVAHIPDSETRDGN